ncbi:Dedicator of cytokinesis protein [Entamoeba marina]
MQEIKCLEPNENIELARILNLPQESESRDGAASIVFKKVKIKTDKQEETKLKLMFDPLDTEGRNMLDVYQIRKFLEKSSLNQPPYYLYEKDVRQLLNEITSLSKSYCVTRKEFPQLLEFFSTQQNELNSLTQPYSLPDAYEKYCTPPNKFEFCTEEIPRVSLLDYESYKSLKLDSFHAAVVDFLFSKPSFVNQSIQWNGIIPDDYFHSIRYAETIQERLPAPLLRRRHIEPPRPKLLFELFTPLYKYKDHAVSLSGVRPKQQLTKPKSRYHVLNLEPVTIGNDGSAPPEQLSYSVALYDQNSQEKITEDIYIENTNSAKVISLMKNQSQGLPIICVVKVFRTTGDDITAARDLYLKGFEDKKAKKKYLERKNIDGKQLLLVGFAAMKDEFEKKSGMVPLKFFKFENETESIFNVFQSQFEGRKQVEMSSKISFQEFFEYDRLVLGVTPYSDVECETPIHIIDNLTRIKQTEDMIHEFINRLFVYPLEVTLGKERKKAFVQVLIQLWENGKPLKCIYPTNGNDFSDSGVSSVTTGKSLIFSDEVKIELPFPLNEKHQLVFIIKLKHDNDEFKQYYSVVPLYAKHILIQSGKMTCPLVPDINARAEENNKRFITFSLNLLSSIYPSTPMSHATINTVIDGKVDNNIHQIPLIDSIHFFPHMLKSFLQSNMVTNITVLELFMKTICGHCSSSEKRNSVAQKYIDHYCTFKSTDVANHLIKALKLMYKYNPNSPQTDVFKHCWLVFEILLKSLQMVGAEKSFWENAHQFVCVFADTIKTHVIKREILGMEEGNAHISYFIRSLMELGFKAHSVKLMESYLDHLVMPYEPEKNSQLDDNSAELIALTMLKTQFLAVYEGSLFLYESSNPGQIDVSDITMLDDMLWIRHLPIAYLMRQHLLLLSRNEEINRISLYLVVGLVARLDLNAELQGEEKENAAAMFLPFVMQFLERYDDFVGWKFVDKHESNTTSVLEKKDDKKKTDSSQLHSTPPQNVSDMEMLGLLCFWVLKNFNRNTLKEWIFNEVPSRLETLIEVLRRYCMLFSYFPLKETIDVYEEIERNIKLIVNGLKEHRYYMPVIPQMPGFEGMLPFMENFPNKPFLIPFQKSLRPMRNDDEGHTILHKFLTDEIVRVCLDMFGLIFDSLLKQESYDLLEKLKGIIATNLFEEKVLNDDVFVFIKNLIIKHRKHIFCGNEEFSVKLLTSFIHTFNSDSARIRGRAVEVLYLYTKNNYIESGNISRTVSLLTTAVVETSDIKMEHFEASVEALKSTQDADIETTTTAVVSIKHDLIEPSYKSLRSRKTIMRTESLGDVEALSVFLKSIIVSRINDLQYLSNLFTTPINGYNQLIDDFVHKKIVVDDQLMEQLQYLVNQFEELTVAEQVNETVKETVSKWEELQILEKKLKVISDERKQDETNIGNICISLRDMCLQGICWAIDKIQKIMNTTTIDLFEQVSLAEIASEKCVIEAETMVDKYKNTMKIVESNPLFPVSVNEFSEIVKGVSDAYKSSATILRTAYNLQKKAQDHENYINERNVQVVTLLQDTLSDILFGLDEFNSGLKAHEISQIRKIKEDEPKSNYGHSTPLEFYEKNTSYYYECSCKN